MAETSLIVTGTSSNDYELKGRPCELSAFSYVPKERTEPIERTYFNTEKKERYTNSTYDRLFHQKEGYNNKLYRCDRDHAKSRGLTVREEEKTKDVPVLMSSAYGQRLAFDLDPPTREHVRIGHVQSEFFRRNDINIRKNKP
ncbi:unnamed protein product [Owenia fusiformis]|uniref:Uncharacterized protein n=1 Tax=Owenia fusiformis TaxID=6347 RepID=A0A8J1TSV1_OWEFU|nr:unnamed protein product [Owenia fusiformis]